ncbi:MAG: DNA-3-methyladenine glycosylase 2 family protein [Pseudomonadota bacterium]
MSPPRHSKAIQHLRQADPRLAAGIDRIGPCRLERLDHGSTFEALARSIAYQQLSGKAAGTIYGRFLKRYGDGKRPDPGKVSRCQLRGLRSVGFSQGKARYIRGLAQAAVLGDLAEEETLHALTDQEVIDQLTPHLGVGVWTVQMLLIFWLNRPDVLAPNDLGIQKGVQFIDELGEVPDAKTTEARGHPWGPHRSVASWYLWRLSDLADSLKRKK